MAAYRYRDRGYQVLVNGQTGAVGGQKPVEWWKVWAVISLMFVPGLALGVVGLPLVFFAGVGAVVLVFALVALVIAIVGAVALHRRATEAEAP